MNNQRGTASFHSKESFKKWFGKKNTVTRFSSVDEGKKISINKGTKSVYITKKSFLGIPHQNKIIAVNRGTQRLII